MTFKALVNSRYRGPGERPER